ncbi:hypothetical protein ACFWUP_23235 [Nocardia sp. NPDC058658]|uniref:hypothetical protein n=1 Tax=Nocardia sp. NPDC058658 TaxID=3346580 RepID=UPI003651BB00
MTGRETPRPPQWSVAGGGENTHSWRHKEIVAAFTPLEVTGAVAQAEVFEQIVRWWDEGLRAFQYAVGESLAQAWSSAGGVAASSAVDAYVAQARELGVVLEKLPEVVRSAAEAIVATKYAIPPLVATEVGTSTRVVDAARAAGQGTALPTGGLAHEARSVSSAGGMALDAGSAAFHGAAATTEEDARAEMRRRYVVPFGELIDRIPLLPMPTRRFDAVGESGDRQMLGDKVGQLPGERRGPAAIDADDSTEIGPNGSVTGGEVSTLAESAGDAVSAGVGVHGTEDPPPGTDTFADDAAETDREPGPMEPDHESTESDGDASEPDGDATAFDDDAAARSTGLDGGAVGEAGQHNGGTVAASVAPDRVMAGGAQPGSASAFTPAPMGATSGMAAPGGTGISVPGGVGISAPGGAGSVTPPWGNSAAAADPSTASAGRTSPTNPPYTGLSSPTESVGYRTPDGRSRYQLPGPNDAQRPGIGHSVAGTAGSAIGANPSTTHAASRLVERYFHCAGAAPTTCAAGEDAARDLPEYLITLANGEELLGRQRPAVAGGVIGGEDYGLPGA